MIIQASGGLGGTGNATVRNRRWTARLTADRCGLFSSDQMSRPYQIVTGALQVAANANPDTKALPTAPSRLRIACVLNATPVLTRTLFLLCENLV